MHGLSKRVNTFGASSVPPVLRILASEAQALNSNAAALVRGVDELDDPARRRVLAWAELVRDASATLLRELVECSGSLQSNGSERPSIGGGL